MEKKTIWIIGSNSDIAGELVKFHNNRFDKIILASRNKTQIDTFIEAMNNSSIQGYSLDLSSKESINSFIADAPEPDVILISAGHIAYTDGIEQTSEENIIQTFRTNVEGPAILLEAIKPVLRKRQGTVIALSSCAGERGKASNKIYSASKSAITTYLEGFMQENEPYAVKTIIFKLGHVDTKMLNNISDSKAVFSTSPKKVADRIIKSIKSNRSQIIYCKWIWKPLITIYKLIPLAIYKRKEL